MVTVAKPVFSPAALKRLRGIVAKRAPGHLAPQDVDDLVGDILLDAWTVHVKRGLPFEPLVFLTAQRPRYYQRAGVAVSRMRSELALPRAEADGDPDVEWGVEACEDSHARQTDLVDLRDLLDRIPPVERVALMRHGVLGESLAQTAQALGIPPSTVHDRVARGRSRVRSMLAAAV